MAVRDVSRKGLQQESRASATIEKTEQLGDEKLDNSTLQVASAKNIPRPATALAFPPKGKLSEYTVWLLGDADLAPVLSDVEKTNNNNRSESRTPLMTVIQAVLKAEGGGMPLGKLVSKIKKYWNRPFPATPYTDEEFVYILARNSGSIRLTE